MSEQTSLAPVVPPETSLGMLVSENTLVERVIKVEVQVDSLNSGFIELRRELSETNRSIGDLKMDVRALDTKIDSVKKDLTNDIRALDAKIDSVKESLDAKIDSVKESLDAKIDGVKESLDAKIDGVEKNLNTKIDALEAKMDTKFDAQKESIVSLKESIVSMKNLMIGTMATVIGGLIVGYALFFLNK